ncbi:phosphoglycerate mutase [Pseudoxanthomonas composti]|uniref:Phosphoglycerate mutase n=1 Tax=Pseudoxanthomonas composti TaxID=2137479 RepID=A0A4Q1JYR5_9GAMM|nr:phosphoglycerate mutase [Pseudoxanthomonas composti]RXR07333.1 phosphoglycerate mutase [Pseudoxanthomonas composti]
MTQATLLLPPRTRLSGALSAGVGRALARADVRSVEPGERAQLHRHFQLVPDRWAPAALTRQRDAKDAAGALWLRADPAYMAPDMNGARMLAHGEALALQADECQALLRALKPLFGDAGMLLDAPVPSRWYLRLTPGTPLPDFTPPHLAVGDDLFAHLPAGDAGRRWRALFNEAQILLHAHPANAARQAAGKAAVNGLWFWGAGTLPDAVRTTHAQVKSREDLLSALAHAAGATDPSAQGSVLVDLRHLTSTEMLCGEALQPLLDELAKGALTGLALDFADGRLAQLQHAQRWRFWRRPLQDLQAL